MTSNLRHTRQSLWRRLQGPSAAVAPADADAHASELLHPAAVADCCLRLLKPDAQHVPQLPDYRLGPELALGSVLGWVVMACGVRDAAVLGQSAVGVPLLLGSGCLESVAEQVLLGPVFADEQQLSALAARRKLLMWQGQAGLHLREAAEQFALCVAPHCMKISDDQASQPMRHDFV